MNASFRDEIVRLIPNLRAYAVVLTRSSTEADDVVQDALMRAWRFRDSFQPGTDLRAWMFKILRNAFLTRVGGVRMVGDAQGRHAAMLRTEPDQEWRLRYHELLASLSKLPEAQRVALVLSAGAGLSYHEVASVCGCSVGTIKSRINRARERLIELLGDPEDPDDPGAPRLPRQGRRPHSAYNRAERDHHAGL